jgi:hypothetical protein
MLIHEIRDRYSSNTYHDYWVKDSPFQIHRYSVSRPQIDGLFTRIESYGNPSLMMPFFIPLEIQELSLVSIIHPPAKNGQRTTDRMVSGEAAISI